jgi:hypothetical protein
MQLHFERHSVSKKGLVAIEEVHSEALYWRYFFAQDFDDAKGARAAVENLLERKQLMDFYLSHSDVNSCRKCKATLGPVVFLDKKLHLCLKCFMVVAEISAADAFRKEDACFSRWTRLDLERLRLRLSLAVDCPSWSVPKAAEIRPRLFSICSQSTQLWPSWFVQSGRAPFLLQDCCENPEKWKFAQSVENITVKTGNMCNVRHTHTLPMNAPPPHTPHTVPRAPPRSTHTDTHMRQEEKIENIPALIRAIIDCKDKSSYVQIALCDFADNSSMHVWRKLFASGIPTCFLTLASIAANTLILFGGSGTWTPVTQTHA